MQPHTFAAPLPPHESGDVQLPQLSVPLHPSEMVPQFFPCAAHDVGEHVHVCDPLHAYPLVHPPQLSVPPHPSEMVPQFLPCAAHDFGEHGFAPHLFGPPPPQFGVAPLHVPHESVLLHPSGMLPQFAP